MNSMKDAFTSTTNGQRLIQAIEAKKAEAAMQVKARIDEADGVVFSTLCVNVPGEGRDKTFRQNLGRSLYNQAKNRVWALAGVNGNPAKLEKLLGAVKFCWTGPEAFKQAADLLTGRVAIEIKTVSLAGLSASQVIARVKELTGRDLGISPKSKQRVITKAVAVLTANGVVVA